MKSQAVRVNGEQFARAQALAEKTLGQPSAASIIREAIARGLEALEAQNKRKKARR